MAELQVTFPMGKTSACHVPWNELTLAMVTSSCRPFGEHYDHDENDHFPGIPMKKKVHRKMR